MHPDLQPDMHPEDHLIGTTLADKYKIVEHIGRGGMGVVYKAMQLYIDRPVAIKVVHTRYAAKDRSCLMRFRMEARAASCLNHPNVMTVYDFGITQEGIAYLVMDYIEGQGLDVLHKQQRILPPPRVISIFAQACNALSHAHSKGVVHRDLKPSNIMLVQGEDGNETVKIVDFGIAKLLPNNGRFSDQFTDTGEIFGSPLYMSPEQCLAQVQDGRSDIYSLGCVMYEMLSGHPAIKGDHVLAVIYKHLNELPLPFAASGVYVPPELESIVFRCLQKNPDHRYQTMNDLKRDLESLQYLIQEAQTEAAQQPAGAPPAVTRTQPIHYPDQGLKDHDTAALFELQMRQQITSEEATNGSDSPKLVPLMLTLAEYYKQHSKEAEAEEMLLKSVRVLVESHGPWSIRVAEAVYKLAEFYLERQRLAEAAPLYRDLIVIKKNTLGPKHPDLAFLMWRLARIYFDLADYKSAEKQFKLAISSARKSFGKDDFILAPLFSGLATTLQRLNRLDEAEIVYKQSLELKLINLDPDHFSIATTYSALGLLFARMGRLEEAEQNLWRAIQIVQWRQGPVHEDPAKWLLCAADVCSHRAIEEPDKADELNGRAESYFRQAIQIFSDLFGNENMKVGHAYQALAEHSLRTNKLQDAEIHYMQALATQQAALRGATSHPSLESALHGLAVTYHELGDWGSAEQYYRRAIESAENSQPMLYNRIVKNHEFLGDLYVDQNRLEEAERSYKKALVLLSEAPQLNPTHLRRKVIALSDRYHASGRDTEANRLRELVEATS